MSSSKLFSFYYNRKLSYITSFAEDTPEKIEEVMLNNLYKLFKEETDRIFDEMCDKVYYGDAYIMTFGRQIHAYEKCPPLHILVRNKFREPGSFLKGLESDWINEITESRTFYVLVKDDMIPLRVLEIIGNVEEYTEEIFN